MTETTGNKNCLLCHSSEVKNYYYPPVSFNSKMFYYYECKNCRAAFIHPLPGNDDFEKMYGTSDHTYLEKLGENEMHVFTTNLPKYNHQRYQLMFFDKYRYAEKKKSLLDIGCGSGFYMHYARQKGMETTGIEFNEEFAKLLRKKTGLSIFSFTEFEEKFNNCAFDIVHLGHFIEHLTEPGKIFDFVKKYSHDETVIIIDGPLEKNPCLSRFVIKTVSMLRRKKENYYPPQHITFTDRKSQLRFFEKQGLTTVNYEIAEQLFPLPEKPVSGSLFKTLLYILGYISVNLSKLNPHWGNIFHYAGRIK